MANITSIPRISLTLRPIHTSTSTHESTDSRHLDTTVALFGYGPDLDASVFTIHTSLYDSVTEGVATYLQVGRDSML